MLRVVTGVPRSGKSYYLVQYLLKFCDYDPIAKVWDLKPRHLVITNIDGLKINHQKFDVLLEQASNLDRVDVKRFASETEEQYLKRKGLTNFFYVPHWEKISKKYDKIILAIDEVQSYFPSYDRSMPNSVWFWFEYHGHFGAEVFVMTQAADSVHRRILAINETFLEAKSPTMRVKSDLFKYTLRDSRSGEIVDSETLKARKEVFNAYKSARHKEGIKERKSFISKYYFIAAAIAFFIPIGGYLFYYSFNQIKERAGGHKSEVVSKSNRASVHLASDKSVIPPGEITRSLIMKWSQLGVDYNDIESLPPSCEIFNKFVRCPPYSLPSAMKMASINYLCPGKSNACFIYFPIKQATEDSPKSLDF